MTATQAVDRAQLTFPEMTDAIGLVHLNDHWAETAARYNLMDDEIWVALTEDDAEVSLAEATARIQKVHFYTGADISKPLKCQEETEKDLYAPSWRTDSSGTPDEYLIGSETSGNTGVRSLRLYPTPDTSTIAISTASNANPIQVATATAHGLSDGDAVRCINVVTNTAANVSGYADVVNTTTFNFYSDSDLTIGIAGNGSGTGGHIVCADSPAIRMFYTRSSTLVGSDNIPNIGPNSDLFVFGVCWRYARSIRDTELMAREKSLLDDAYKNFEAFRSLQAEGSGVRILPYHMQSRRVF